ncbi:MAG TPA: hypothetical protein VHV78_07070, partial [Gemmatimonadaceae bacterium]|nr:hypothetical protein [Gemmatimonadaceae bacterium]
MIAATRAAPRWTLAAVGFAGLLVASVSPASAQRAVLHGVVNDSTGAPVPEADVAIVSLHKLARSDAK